MEHNRKFKAHEGIMILDDFLNLIVQTLFIANGWIQQMINDFPYQCGCDGATHLWNPFI